MNYLSIFMQAPTEHHYKAAKRILRYIRDTIDFGIIYNRAISVKLLGFSDNDWVGNDEDMKSILGHCFTVRTGMISWSSKRQGSVA